MLENTVQAERHYSLKYVRGVHTRFLKEFEAILEKHRKNYRVGVCPSWNLGWSSELGDYIYLVTNIDRESLYRDIPRRYRGVYVHVFQLK